MSDKLEVPTQIIPPDAKFFRAVYNKNMDSKDHRLPSESNFTYKQGNDGLSVDWNKYFNPDNTLITIGLSFKKDKFIFKDPNEYFVFSLERVKINFLPHIDAIEHNPKFFGNPPPDGSPNNPAHTLIKYENDIKKEDEIELRVKLRDIAIKESVNINFVLKEVINKKKSFWGI